MSSIVTVGRLQFCLTVLYDTPLLVYGYVTNLEQYNYESMVKYMHICLIHTLPLKWTYIYKHGSSPSPPGWDINSADIAAACERAAVLDVAVQDALKPQLSKMRPRPSIYCPDFIAANQEDRADNVLNGV